MTYLVLARGTGGDQRTVSWSVHAIETRTGISRPNAKKAIDRLKQAGLVRQVRGGTKPQYFLVPAHEIQPDPSEGLSDEEQRVLSVIASGTKWVPKSARWDVWGTGRPFLVAMALAKKGRLIHVRGQTFEILQNATESSDPDWIWLPNALIDGLSGEVAPVELIRQAQNPSALRLFIDLYHEQDLPNFGGIDWHPGSGGIRIRYDRTRLGECGAFVIWGFRNARTWADRKIAAPYMTGQAGDDGDDIGWQEFWRDFNLLHGLGLAISTPTIVESFTDEGEPILPLGSHTEAEQKVTDAVELAVLAITSADGREWLEKRAEGFDYCAPLRKHQSQIEMIGVVRLRYLPDTEMTRAWLERVSKESIAWTNRFLEVAASEGGYVLPLQHQGSIKV